MPLTTFNRHAFSLVELSIVLVILGLLTGGILTGQSLIRAAELRAVTTELQNHQTAVQTFRSKYFALPGDMNNAERFWDTMATGTCPNATAGTGTQTCNGDGDGRIEPSGTASQSNESFTFWQHLANAGLIEGTYTGIAGSGGPGDAEISENVPASRLSNTGWFMQHFTDGDLSLNYNLPEDYGNTFFFGTNWVNNDTGNIALTPEEAWSIDKKVDDGRPAYGKTIARFWDSACTDATSATDLDSDYRLQDASIQCALFFRDMF